MNNTLTFNTVVSTRANELTQTELVICNFIKAHRDIFVETSTAKLAETMEVGEASIIRFCKKLGYKGLADLKKVLRAEIDNDIPQYQTITSMEEKTNSFQDIAAQLAKTTKLSIDDTVALQNESDLDHVASMLSKATNIYFYGIGMSAVSAMYAKYRFMRIRQNIDAIMDNHGLLLNTNHLTSSDVVIAISHSGDTSEIVASLSRAKEKGASTIILTKFQSSRLSGFADIVLLTGGTENPYESDSSTITSSQQYMIDVLFHSLVFIDKGRSTSKLVEALKIVQIDKGSETRLIGG